MQDILRHLPKMDEFLTRWGEEFSAESIKLAAKRELDCLREEVLRGEREWDREQLRQRAFEGVRARLVELARPFLREVINATGIILHTGLGRAVLPLVAREGLVECGGAGLLEVDRHSGKRGVREKVVAQLLCELTGAEAATVVNNNAAAVLLALRALAAGREVVISRGQMVEIGGSFRIPEVMAQSGCILVEVGCTNRTHPRDYEEAIGERTALLLEVHPSNYRVEGFTASVDTRTLVEIGRRRGVPVMCDLGSGCLVDLERYGLPHEPTVQEKMESGVDLATFSGDKLLGGPQAGILVGKRSLIEKVRRHPLFRALRPCKLTLGALERTLRVYRCSPRLEVELPVLRMLTLGQEEIAERVEAFCQRVSSCWEVERVEGVSCVGSGALPGLELPTVLVSLRWPGKSAEEVSGALRGSEPPVFGRIQGERVLLDFRTVWPSQEEGLLSVLNGFTSMNFPKAK
ncbi:MAG: L-seryl-tRNA(Sec) selenium transferase [Planctomycetota bacterium]|nr:MAG: L-seryl-tRNA(Sec) selenium transferase [Planctomycetota bacterium]